MSLFIRLGILFYVFNKKVSSLSTEQMLVCSVYQWSKYCLCIFNLYLLCMLYQYANNYYNKFDMIYVVLCVKIVTASHI